MSDTPRTNIAEGVVGETPLSEDEWPDFARQLERELAQAKEQLAAREKILERIKNDTILDKQDAEYYKRIMLVHINWIEDELRRMAQERQ